LLNIALGPKILPALEEAVRFKLFNKARIDEKENEPTSADWMGFY
jgi:hypothetical protein